MRTVALMLLLIACSQPRRERTYETLLALDDGTAIVTWHDDANRYFAGRLDAASQMSWSTSLRGRTQHAWFRSSALATAEVVALRTFRRDSREAAVMIEGLALKDGERRWSQELRTTDRGDFFLGLNRVFTGFADTQSFHVFLESGYGYPAELVSIDARSGDISKRQNLEIRDAGSVVRHGNAVVLHDFGLQALDTAAPLAPLESYGVGCFLGDAYWRLVRADQGWQLLGPSGSTPIEVPHPREESVSLEGCARYRDLVVALTRVRGMTDLIMFHPDRSVARRVRLKRVITEVQRVAPIFATDMLPRFVPLLVGDERGRSITMIDLERGEQTWSIAANGHYLLGHFGDDWIVTWINGGTNVAIVEGASGRLRAAVQIDKPLIPLEPQHVGASLWMLSPDPTSARAVPVIKLDASLRLVSGQAFPMRDLRADPALAAIPR